MDSGIAIAILGHGTCGKTTSARFLASTYGLGYKHSTSEFAKKTIELPGNHEDRAQHRVAWAQAIADFNNEDEGIKLYKLMAEDHDIFDGIRRVNELGRLYQWMTSRNKIFVPIWIDRAVPEDPGCHDIRPKHCRFTVNNHGDLTTLHTNLNLLWRGMQAFR